MEQTFWKKSPASLCVDTVLRLSLGGMFLYSAWSKVPDPWMFQTIVDDYSLLPANMTALFAVTIPQVELLVVVMFILTKWTREAAFATTVILMMFLVALAQAQVRGLDISCGCFGETEGETHSVLHALIRDILLFTPTIWLLIKGQRRWIVDFKWK